MRYYFRFRDEFAAQPKEDYIVCMYGEEYCPDAYWDADAIRKIPLYEETPEILQIFHDPDNPDSDYWPVFSVDGWSTEPVECRDMEEAYDQLQQALNESIYERRHDI